MFLAWFDDDPKKPTAKKIQLAIAAYQERFGTAPTVVLCHVVDECEVAGVEVRVSVRVARNNFQLGLIAE